MGSQDIEVGYPGFDDNYVIQGTSEHRVRKFCENERIRELIASQPRIHLEVRDDEGWFKAQFPERVDQLYFQCHGVIKDIGRLEKLFEMVAESLHQLCHDGKVYEDDIDIHIGRLSGPGGTIKGKHVLWEGAPPRHDAAQALGRLKDPKARRGTGLRALERRHYASRARDRRVREHRTPQRDRAAHPASR